MLKVDILFHHTLNNLYIHQISSFHKSSHLLIIVYEHNIALKFLLQLWLSIIFFIIHHNSYININKNINNNIKFITKKFITKTVINKKITKINLNDIYLQSYNQQNHHLKIMINHYPHQYQSKIHDIQPLNSAIS
jgi:hypothetical protein